MRYSSLLIIVFIFISLDSFAITKDIGKGYCTLRHPVEALTSNRITCESQHVIQQNAGGGNYENTVWINTIEHDYLDRSSDKPWYNERPWAGSLVDDNAESAYMLATYANGFHYIIYDHHGNGIPTIIKWDGVSHIVYFLGSVINIITKHASYIGYQIERFNKGQQTQFIDAVIAIFIDTAELYIGFFYSVIGLVIGTILNPIDTLFNIPGGILLALETAVEGVANTVSDLISLITLGYIEL